DYQVGKSGVDVVDTARIVSVQPVTVNLVMIFSDIWATILFMGLGIGLQFAEKIFFVHRVIFIIIQQAGQPFQRLGGGKRPDRSIPLGGADSGTPELRM